MPWWEIIGWAGSVLVVVSLMVPSVRRFRILNLTGSAIATVYNAYFEIWPYAAMNGAICIINIYWLWRLSQEGKTADRGYSVVEARETDPVVKRFLARNEKTISESYPAFTEESLEGNRTFMLLHEEEVIGLFSVRDRGEGSAEIVLDYVTERFRDFTPGNFLYANSTLFDTIDVETLHVNAGHTTDPAYFKKQGFKPSGDELVRSV